MVKKKRKKGRWVLAVLVVAAAVGGGVWWAKKEEQKRRKAIQVERNFFDRTHLVALADLRKPAPLREALKVDGNAKLKACLAGKGKACKSFFAPDFKPYDDANGHMNTTLTLVGGTCTEGTPDCKIRRSVGYRLECASDKACERIVIRMNSEYIGGEPGKGEVRSRKSDVIVPGAELVAEPKKAPEHPLVKAMKERRQDAQKQKSRPPSKRESGSRSKP